MPADAFWTFAMAVNIYLTFYHRFDAARLTKMEIPYLICCFGVPFVPALVFVFLKDGAGQRVYGDARLWCWISREWHILRIAAFYAPVWYVLEETIIVPLDAFRLMLISYRVLILATILIYLRAGHTIYRKRNELQQVSDQNISPVTVATTADDDAENTKTTEITVTTQISTNDADVVTSQLQSLGLHGIYNPHEEGYFVSISSGRNAAGRLADGDGGRQTHISVTGQKKAELNRAAWSYTKCAVLFFTALLVTWIPSSANRVYAFTHDNESLLALEFMSALVLPLQGFWNAVIYAVTSWNACKSAWARVISATGRLTDRILLRRRGIMTQTGGSTSGGSRQHRGYRLGSSPPTTRRGDHMMGESDSMTELASPERPQAARRRDS
jgi:hypothetical protein